MTKKRKSDEELRIFMIAGEPSGDQLGGKLIAALERIVTGRLVVQGVGGEAMEQAGCSSLFPLSDVAVMGPLAIAARLPRLIKRVYQTTDAAIAANPDVLVIIDSPEFTHPIARRVRRRLPGIPIVDYVSPSVWAWRSGRARKMRRYVNHVLALLPFEPAAHEQLGGPQCTYVGHPLIERLDWITGLKPESLAKKLGLKRGRKVLAVLPGSRRTEVTLLMEPFGGTLKHVIDKIGDVEVIIPVVPSVRKLVEEGVKSWPVKPHLVEGETDKFNAFKLADAALAASGTVTLELALAGTPMAVGYRTEAIVAMFRWMLKAHSIVLPNLILGENIFPEFIQEDCTPDILSNALLPLLDNKSPERKRQIHALKNIEKKMRLARGTPSETAAKIILSQTRFKS